MIEMEELPVEKKPDKVPKFRYKQNVVVISGFLRDHIGDVREARVRGFWFGEKRTEYRVNFRDNYMNDAWVEEDRLKKWTEADDKALNERAKIRESEQP